MSARMSEPKHESRSPEQARATATGAEAEVARLRRELAEALERQAATAEVLRVIASAPTDIQAVLDAVAENASRLCDAEDVAILEQAENVFRVVAFRGSDRLKAFAGTPVSRGSVAGRAMLDRQTIHVQDISEEPDAEYPVSKAVREQFGHRTMLATPLLREGTPIGAIFVRRTEVRPFTEQQIALLATFADQAVIAIENARLFQELADLNRTLEARVSEQVDQLERVGRLRRYLSPQLAEVIISSGDESILASHRRQITVVFCDLRGFTAFAEMAEPEEVMAVLAEYHAAMGELIRKYEGTFGHFAGDGLMIFFNDPLPQPDHVERAVQMACVMRERAADLARGWRRAGYELGFGVGIAVGYATLGRIGFEGRYEYDVIGTVANLAARLCAEAAGGQILVPARLHGMVEDRVEAEPVGELALKGLHRPVIAFNITGLREEGSLPPDRATGQAGADA
jgi:adenylate cyclase